MRDGEGRLIQIRALQDDDRGPIRAILVATGVFTAEEVDVALELIDYALNDRLQQDYDFRVGIAESGEVAGYYCTGPTPLTVGTYDLYWIAVNPSLHDRGIGRQLLNDAEKLVRSQGGRLLIAETSSQPKYEHTRTFYLKNQYSEVARIREYYKVGDDLVVYGKYLSQSGV
jgi:ribosomal protein S18 acetylase RimI-like enzyme